VIGVAQDETIVIPGLEPSELETLREILGTIGFLKSYMNDQMIHDLSEALSTTFKLVNILLSTDLIEIMERAMQDPDLDRALLDPIGVMEKYTSGELDEEAEEYMERGMGIMMALLKAIGKASTS